MAKRESEDTNAVAVLAVYELAYLALAYFGFTWLEGIRLERSTWLS